MAKYRSGRYGIYSLVINKLQTESVDKNGIAITEPIILPAFVNYKNTRNGEIFEVSVNYQDNIIHGLSLYTLTEVYSVNNNKVSVTRSVWDIQKTREIKKPKKELSPATYANYRFDRIESLSQSFLPVAIMPVDLHEKPRCHKIKSKLEMMEKYEEISAILPHWEKGGIMTTSDQVDNPNEEKNNNDFINYLLLKGMVRMKPIVGDGQVFLPFNQSVVTWQPNSLMQTMRNTRNDIWNEIKTDLRIPNIDEIKSAQQTTAEIQANQFLVSSAIEREKMLYVNFLQDFGKKFLMMLKECNLKEGSLLQGYDFSDWTVDLDIDLTTQKNILQTMNMITNTPTINNNQEDTNNGK
ncbi:hypothetical protein [Spiroplasma poulsonii]|uniref:hypothetical protein n=2 Tax=Spiroplasma TaxID=2132 RepID=UPI001F4CA8D8|nr:hypothetical protein [Spiroplasma poulsonii]UNF61339.1 hypothetical protein MNU24_05335 [Spiroplasma poulsonii]